MKVSRLIELLQEFQEQRGDLDVKLKEEHPGFDMQNVTGLECIRGQQSEYKPPLEGTFRHGAYVCLIDGD